MMGLVGNVVDAAIGCLVQGILESFFTKHMEVWIREVELDEDVDKLEFEMRHAEMVLSASGGRKIDNKPLAQSLDGVRELLYDAEDVTDELDYYRLQQQIEQGKGCSAGTGNNPEASCASSSTPSSPHQLVFSARSQIISWVSSERKRKQEEEEQTDSIMLPHETKLDISKRINGIANNLHKFCNSIQGFLQLDISRLVSTPNQRQRGVRNTRLTTSLPIEPKVYGRDADRNMVIELLLNEGSSDLCVLPIVGIGGIGKTTLARYVYRDQRVINHFDLQMWICVSTNFNEVRLTLEILEHVCKDRQEYRDVSNFNVLQEILLKNIREKIFLLILDDMWEDKDKSGWNKLLAPLKCNQVSGCMVLATTRRNSVAEMIGTLSPFQISGLDEKEFWLFFKTCAFGNENYEGHPSLQSIGQQIIKALKGCPLAAQSVGALLNRNISYEHWRTVQDKWKYLQVKDDDIIPILKLSYDYLPFCLQRCFSYCSMFPEDHQFKGETLVQAWISQNFVQCEDTVFNVGIYGTFSVPTGTNNLVSLRHLIAGNEVHYAINCVGTMTSLQELKFKVKNIGGFEIRQLRCMNELVMLGISQIANIRTKEEASGARLIDKEHLKELSLSWSCGNIGLEPEKTKEVLEGLQPHHNLKTICIIGYNGPNSPTWLSSNLSVTSLQSIHLENCSEWQTLRSLEMLPLLRKLKLVKMPNLVEVSFPSLEELILVEMPKLEKCFGYGTELTADLRVLIIKDCPQVKEFSPFQCYSYFGAEKWFPSLSELVIGCCPHISKWEIFPLREMQSLKKLELIDMHAVRELLVPSLDELVLIKMPRLEYCTGLTASPPLQISTSQVYQKEWLSSLRKLTIHDCPCLIVSHPLPPSDMMSHLSIKGIPTVSNMEKKIGFTIKSNDLIMLDDKILAFQKLRGVGSLRIEDCPNLVSISNEGINQLTRLEGLRIKNCPNLVLPNRLVLPSLRFLTVQACGATGSWLTQMLSHVQSLDELELCDCAQIKSLSFSQPAGVKGNSSLASAMTPSPRDEQLLKLPSIMLSSLRLLTISDCPDLEFSGEEGALQGYTSLKHLRIRRCPKLIPLLVSGKGDVGSLPPSLRSFHIDMSPVLSAAWDLKLKELEQSGSLIPRPPLSLEILYISNLTDKVQSRLLSCLPTIRKLLIRESPELTSIQLGYSKALRELGLIDCQSLASIEGFGSLTNLCCITVYDSPGLPRCLELLPQQQGASEILSRLGKLRVDDGSVLTMSLCKHLTSLTWICFWPEHKKRGATMMGLTEEQERALQLLTTLNRLNFWYFPNLLSLPSNLSRLTSLKMLDITGCPRVTRLPEMGLPPSLTELSVHWCSEELHMQCRMEATEKLKVLIDGICVD
uniref:NB-ARC domain-containing protein n=1 Tax=Leersia perrieri TaxID=77586 RepID=A0A0D9W3S1_9ORYZ